MTIVEKNYISKETKAPSGILQKINLTKENFTRFRDLMKRREQTQPHPPMPIIQTTPATRPPVPPTTFRSMNPVLGPEGIRPIREPVTVLPKPVTNPLLNFGKTTPVGRPSPPPYEQMGIPVYYQKSIPHAPKGSPQFNNAYNNAVRWMNRQIEAGKLSPNCQIAVQGDGRRTYFTVTEPVARY